MADWQRSITVPILQHSAEDLVRKISGDHSPAALSLLLEAKTLVEVIEAWKTCTPTDEVRGAVIQQLFELNRRALAHLLRPPERRRTPQPLAPVDEDD